jgi:hypothetical protein
MRAGAKFPPIVVGRVGNAPVLVDGWHRVAAAERAGIFRLAATVIEGTPEELKWRAAEANLTHGRPLSRAEDREVFRAYVKAGRHRKTQRRIKSAREIAADLNGSRSHTTILNWMRQDFRSIYERMRRCEDEPRHDGGTPSTDSDVEARMVQTVLANLNEARAAMAAITDPVARGELIAQAETLIAEMKAQGAWNPPPVEDEFEF